MAYLEWGTKKLTNKDGEEILAVGSELVRYESSITCNWRIGVDADEYAIVKIEKLRDFGNVGIRLWLV